MYGANKSMLQLILELKEKYRITPVVLMRLKGVLCDHLERYGIDYIVSHFYWWVYEKGKSNNRLHEVIKQFKNVSRIKKIGAQVSLYKIDMVYTNSITVNIGLCLSKSLGCKHIWHIREGLDQFDFNFSLGKRFARKCFRRYAHKIIFISNYVERSYKNIIPKADIHIIYNGILPPKTIRNENTIRGNIKICMVGLISRHKNQLDAFKALKNLVKEKKINNIHLYIIGVSKQEYKQQLENFINLNKLEKFVTFMGHQNDVPQILQYMNLGLTCSRNEAFGRVTIEYMINRIPVIASDSGANPEIVHAGKNGEIYSLYNNVELASKILKFIDNPTLLEEYGSYAQRYAIENFSSEKNTNKVYQQIQDTLTND